MRTRNSSIRSGVEPHHGLRLPIRGSRIFRFISAAALAAMAFLYVTPRAQAVFDSTAYGDGALASANLNEGRDSAFGFQALYNTDTHTGVMNTGAGAYALFYNVMGSRNTAVGDEAMIHNTVSDNTAIGYAALYHNSQGTFNTATGGQALTFSTGSQNTANGYQSLRGVSDSNGNAVSTGSYNTATGYQSLLSFTNGSYNVANGWQALYSNSSGSYNTATGAGALSQNITGINNTASGINALFYSNGPNNTADGANSLQRNTTGKENTAIGSEALFGSLDANGNPNSTGNFNTASGFQALYSNQNGTGNVATGWQTLYSNKTGSSNTALGNTALSQNKAGNQNTATGVNALYYNDGGNNTATGFAALQNNTTGLNNVALGYKAGYNITAGGSNIVIGANVLGTASDANITRIGNMTQKKTFIGGIYNKTVASGVGVIVNSSGQLGTVQSSARYKDDIKPMDKTSEAILKLKPVTFRYKEELDPDKIPQFGLIAEQVEKVNPDLVVRDEGGKVITVRYEAVNAMLLNEFLKEHAQVQELKATVAHQQQQIEGLTAGLQKVKAQRALKTVAPAIAASSD